MAGSNSVQPENWPEMELREYQGTPVQETSSVVPLAISGISVVLVAERAASASEATGAHLGYLDLVAAGFGSAALFVIDVLLFAPAFVDD